MASQVNPLAAGSITEDPRFNKRFGLEPEQGYPEFFPVVGVPSNAVGANGDFAFRVDGGAATCIYQKRAGAWVATGA